MKEVRIGVIGCGNMGQIHMAYMNSIAGLKLTAASDSVQPNLTKAVDKYNVRGFADATAMMDSGEIDAVLIATPHYSHPELSIAAIKRGLHVMVEKPVAVTALAAQQMNEAYKKYGKKLVFAANFQMRASPIWVKVKQLVDSGAIGQIQRTNWIVTNWFRTQAYYDSGSWRATWKGEGGGVLLNQCPHNLDLFQWIAGMPSKVTAFIGLGKHHHIEVEDDVTAYLEYPSGATGVFITTTGEAPGTNRLELVGDQGKLTVDLTAHANRIELQQTLQNVRQFNRSSPESFPNLPTNKTTIEVDSSQYAGAKNMTENFVQAILQGKKPVAPATEGIHSIELANAMLMSGLSGKSIELPMDRKGYDKLLAKLIRDSKFKKGAVKAAVVNMGSSFKH